MPNGRKAPHGVAPSENQNPYADSDTDGSTHSFEASFLPKQDAQKPPPRSKKPSSDSESHPRDGGVLTQQAANLIRNRRNDAAANMAKTHASSRDDGGKKKKRKSQTSRHSSSSGRGRSRSRSRSPRHRSRRYRSPSYSDDSQDSRDGRRDSRGNERDPELLDQIARMKREFAEERQAFQAQLDAATTKKRTKHTSTIPYDPKLVQVIDTTVKQILWRDTKFLVNKTQQLEATAQVMLEIPEVKAKYCMDPENREANIEAFNTTYGDEVVKSLNNRRTEAQSTVQKAYEKRYRSGAMMPSSSRMLEVILRKGMKPGAKDLSGAEVTEEYALQNVELFTWYWDKVLIAACGMSRWSHSQKYFAIPSRGKDVVTKLKWVNSSDEAMIALYFENCGQRFPYLTSLIANGAKKDPSNPLYQTAYSDSNGGQQKWGGWNLEGRKRFKEFRQHIGDARKQPHVVPLEETVLGILRRMRNLDQKKERKSGKEKPDYVNNDEAVVEMDWSSDREDSTELGELTPFSGTYKKPHVRQSQRNRAPGEGSDEEEREED